MLALQSTEPDVVAAAIGRTASGADGRLAVWLPDGTRLGDPTPGDDGALELARDRRQAFTRNRDGARELYSPVLSGTSVSVVRARVPHALLEDGVTTAWAALASVAVALVVAAALVADRLARSLTRDATGLSATARALATGDADARASPGPTPELSDAARALNLLADRIGELRAAERERVADLSHRLGTPLTALRLQADAAGEPEIVAGVDRLEAAVNELIRSARRPLHGGATVATCELSAVVEGRARHWSALADDDNRAWTLDAVSAPVVVRLPRTEAAAALDALIGNVFAHTPDGTAYALVLQRRGDRAVLDVDDAGPGIPSAAAGAVVARGATGAGSTGLGLDIARRAAEAAGGSLTIDRSPLGGARVRLDLPLSGEGA